MYDKPQSHFVVSPQFNFSFSLVRGKTDLDPDEAFDKVAAIIRSLNDSSLIKRIKNAAASKLKEVEQSENGGYLPDTYKTEPMAVRALQQLCKRLPSWKYLDEYGLEHSMGKAVFFDSHASEIDEIRFLFLLHFPTRSLYNQSEGVASTTRWDILKQRCLEVLLSILARTSFYYPICDATSFRKKALSCIGFCDAVPFQHHFEWSGSKHCLPPLAKVKKEIKDTMITLMSTELCPKLKGLEEIISFGKPSFELYKEYVL
jgi:hypothetical protein